MIRKVTIELMDNGNYRVDVIKAFDPEHGGGEQTFTELGGTSLHAALDRARGMVTVTPARKTA